MAERDYGLVPLDAKARSVSLCDNVSDFPSMTRVDLTREEQACAERLASKLRTEGRLVSFTKGSDPPDLEFMVDGEPWAVEVTGLVPLRQIDGKSLPQDALDARAHGLSKKIEQAAANCGNGRYLLDVDSAQLDKREVARIVEEATRFILSKKSGTQMLQSHGAGYITRTSVEGPLEVGVNWTGGSEDILADQRSSMRDQLDDKLPKLGKLRSSYKRTVLCLWSRNMWHQEVRLRATLAAYGQPLVSVDLIVFIDDDKTVQIYP